MNSRERVLAAINHKQPDRFPFDIGSSMMTGIHRDAYHHWRNFLGLAKQDTIRYFEPSMQIVYIEEDFRQHLRIDTSPALPAWPENFPLNVLEDGESFYYYDEWGYGLKMPKSDPIYFSLFHHPLRNANSLSDLNQFHCPDSTDKTRLAPIEEQIKLAEKNQKAIVLNNVCAGTMEVASWLRGLDQFLIDLALQPVMAEFLLEKVMEFKLAYWEMVLSKYGDKIDVVVESDDIGTQTSTLISPRMYRKYIKPYHKKILEFIHSKTSAKIFFHSCGAIRQIIPDLIEIGVDILNPVQFNLPGMDPIELKSEFGNDLVFWGGGVETQYVLSRGSQQEVEKSVKSQLENLGKDGGFVFATVHNIQAEVPVENLSTMWKTVMDFGK